MAPRSVPSSEEVRMKGNELYKNGKITEAVLFYMRATELSPTERAPWTNLSAAYFELGNYSQAITACDTALSLLDPDAPDYHSIKQKHVVRRAKSCLFLGRFKDAALANTADGSAFGSEDMLSECVKCYAELTEQIPDIVKARSEMVLNLPRFRPTLINTAEYYPIGHDTPESLYDLELSRSPRPTVSFLFGGIGDARNLFHTLIQVAKQDRKSTPDARKFYHFTIVDIKPSAIARDLVILLLLDELSQLSDRTDKVENSTILLCLFYTYTTSIMPSSLHDVLQGKISQATTALMKDTLPAYIEIPSMYRADILRYLQDWQNTVQRKYPITRVQSQVVQTRAVEEQQHVAFGGSASAINLPSDTALAKERLFDSLTGAVMLPSPHQKLLAPDLQKAFNSFDGRSSRASVKEAVGVIRKTWSTNVTLVDLAWEQSRDPDPFMDIDVGENPYSFCNKMIEAGFKPRGGKSLFDYAAPWFISIAQALRDLKDCIRIEACVGDVVAVLEQIKYGAVGHRQPKPSESPGKVMQAEVQGTYPQMYDRIYLSNVPDYIGGSLTSYMYALQMIFPGKDSYITSTCLRNPPRFETVASFDAGYVGLYTESDLEKLFHVRMKPNSDPFMPTCAYNKWHHHIASRKYGDLTSRTKLETWLYRLFLKVAIPLERRSIVDNQLIYSPLNLTFFFRLCDHLHTIGYPAHWLSEILSSILSGSIITTSRPPRSEPLKLREIDTVRKALTQSVAPFKAEFSTFATMWQSLLPFGILSSNIAPVESIMEYSAYFKQISGETIAYPTFVIVFYKGTLPMSVKYDLRKALLSDERGHKEYGVLREHGMHIISTWSWHRDSRTAKFWLRKDVMKKMEQENWQVCIYRTDNWSPQSSAYTFSSARVKEIGPSWVQRVNAQTDI